MSPEEHATILVGSAAAAAQIQRWDILEEQFATALRKARYDALEEAAVLCFDAPPGRSVYDMVHHIRALRDEEAK